MESESLAGVRSGPRIDPRGRRIAAKLARCPTFPETLYYFYRDSASAHLYISTFNS